MIADTLLYLFEWNQKLIEQGWCGAVGMEALFEYVEGMGNAPVEDMLRRAEAVTWEWKMDESKMKEFIVKSKRWCARPTGGCRHYCPSNKWQEPWARGEEK